MLRVAIVVLGLLASLVAGCGSVDVQGGGGCVVTDMTADRICDGNIVFFVDNCGNKTPNIDQNCADQDLICRNGACVVDDPQPGGSCGDGVCDQGEGPSTCAADCQVSDGPGSCGDGVLDLANEACECSVDVTQCSNDDDANLAIDGASGADCVDMGYSGGRLGCINCQLVTSECTGCVADCLNKTCGGDGCGGSCGVCLPGEVCAPVGGGMACRVDGGCGDGVFEPPAEKCECGDGTTDCATEEGEVGVIETSINTNTWCTQLPGEDFAGGALRCVGCMLNTSACF